MEEHRNQATVERKLKDAMRHDRARIQLGRISPFGLLEMSRQRLRPSLLEASTQPCPHCNGTGHIRSTESTALHVLRAIEEEGMRRRSAEISVAVPTAVALYILNHKRDTLVRAEQRYGFRVAVTSDDTLIPPAFRLERLRALTPAEIAALPTLAPPVAEPEEEEEAIEEEPLEEAEAEHAGEAEAETAMAGEPAAAGEGGTPRPEPAEGEEGRGRRRRRRRRRGRREDGREGAPQAREAPPPRERNREPEGEAYEERPYEGRPMMPPPLQDVTAPLDFPDDEGFEDEAEPEQQPGEGAHAGAPQGAPGGEQGARKRRRRGRRGGRRRRRDEPGQEALPPAADQPMIADEPIAEQIEYVPPPPLPEDEAKLDVEMAFSAAPAPRAEESGAESVPVADRGDQPAAPAPRPEPEPAAAAQPPRHVASVEAPTHTVEGTPSNPKRGWWRRVIDP